MGPGVWGKPEDRDGALAVLRRHVVELDVNFIDTADSYGPEVSERLIAEALPTPTRPTWWFLRRAGSPVRGPGGVGARPCCQPSG